MFLNIWENPQNGWFIRENPIKKDDLGVFKWVFLKIWDTPLEHTPKLLPTGYTGIPFIKNSYFKKISQKTRLLRFGCTLQPLPGQQSITSSHQVVLLSQKKNYTLLKTNMTMENLPCSIGNTSSNRGFSIAIFVSSLTSGVEAIGGGSTTPALSRLGWSSKEVLPTSSVL